MMGERINAVEAAHILGISRDAVCRRAAAGLLPVLSKGNGRTGAYTFDRAAIEHVVNEQAEDLVERAEFLRRRLVDPDEDLRIDLVDFLLRELGEATDEAEVDVATLHVMTLLVEAVNRRYVQVRGHQPDWDHGYVYRGYTDFLIIRDTFHDEITEEGP